MGLWILKKHFILRAFNYAVSDINVESLYRHSHYKNIQVKTENKSNELLG
jgi:hypothetical protein